MTTHHWLRLTNSNLLRLMTTYYLLLITWFETQSSVLSGKLVLMRYRFRVVEEFLASQGLERFARVLEANGVDEETLPQLSFSDLQEMQVSLPLSTSSQ